MQALSHREFKGFKRFPAIDGLRAIGALLVVDFHFDGKWPWMSGWIGVHIFFVVSGFLITTLLLREESSYGKVSLRNFLVRRVFRIMPVYFVILGLTAAVAVRNGAYDGMRGALPYYLTFFNEEAPPGWFTHSWTLGIEQKFYLFWPLIAFAVVAVARFRPALTTALVCTGLAISIASSPYFALDAAWLGPASVRVVHYTGLLIGCLLAVLMHSERGFAAIRFLTIPWVGVLTIALWATAHLSISSMVPRFGEPAVIAVYDLTVALMLPSVLRMGLVSKVLSTRVMCFIGERSYSLYLIQALGGMAAAGLFPSLPHGKSMTLAVTLLSIGAADLLYRWVEMPMIGFGRRFTKSRRPAAGASATPAEPEPGLVTLPAPAILPATGDNTVRLNQSGGTKTL